MTIADEPNRNALDELLREVCAAVVAAGTPPAQGREVARHIVAVVISEFQQLDTRPAGGPTTLPRSIPAEVVTAGVKSACRFLIRSPHHGAGKPDAPEFQSLALDASLKAQARLLASQQQPTIADRLLAAGPGSDWDHAARDAAAVGLGPHAVGWLIVGAVGEEALREATQHVLDVASPALAATPRMSSMHHNVVLIDADRVPWGARLKAVEEVLAARPAVQYLVGREASTLSKAVRSARRFSETFSTVRLVSGTSLFDTGNVAIYGALSSLPILERVHVFESILGPLAASNRWASLLHLQDALVRTGTVEAAERLAGYSRRSTSRHMNTIADLTGYHWKCPPHRFALSFATLLRWLAALYPEDYSVHVWGPYPRHVILGDV